MFGADNDAQVIEIVAKAQAETAELARIQRSIRYRLGEILVAIVKRPLSLGRHMQAISELIKTSRRRGSWLRFLANVETGVPNEPLRSVEPPLLTREVRRIYAMASGQAQLDFEELTAGQSPAAERFRELIELPGRFAGAAKRVDTLAENASGPLLYVLNAALPATRNGYTRRAHSIADALQKRGHEVRIIALSRFRLEETHVDYEIEGVSYRLVDGTRFSPGILGAINDYSAAIAAYSRALGSNRILAASNWMIGLAGWRAAELESARFAYEIRGFWEETRATIQRGYTKTPAYEIQTQMELRVAAAASRVFVLNGAMTEKLIDSHIDERKIDVVPNGFLESQRVGKCPARIEDFCARHNFVIGFVGSLTAYENIELLIDAVADLNKARKNKIGVLIVGKGPSAESLAAQSRRLGTPRWLSLAGELDGPDARTCYQHLDAVFCARSRSRLTDLVQPLKPIEAMGHKLPVILSDAGALLELADDENRAIVVQSGSVSSLRNAIERLVSDPSLRLHLGTNAQRWVLSERRWERCVDAIALYHQ